MDPVTLVVMPLVDLERPNLGLSLLQALLEREGIGSRIVYGNLQFADSIGLRRYSLLVGGARSWHTLYLGEAIFSHSAFPERELDLEDLLDFMLARLPVTEEFRAQQARNFRELQRLAGDLVDDLARQIVAAGPRLVGCTSTFQQHIPSLALLRRIRQLDPGIITLMGGANCETGMGVVTHKRFPWVDFVVSGEADGLIGPLCRDLLQRGRELEEVPEGVLAPLHRRSGYPPNPRATFDDLDSLPYPDFQDYFEQLGAGRLGPAVRSGLPLETSRGCWWGAKHHCTFCGLNAGGMAFRRKSGPRALAELEWLSERWGITDVEVVDNILDMRYFDTLIPALTASPKTWNIFYEVKSNLKPEQLQALAAAGVRSLQPGLESLDSRVLKLMDKGARGYQQVQFLKFAREYGIGVSWNILMDFPGEKDEWYLEMAELLPLLTHLQPPSGVVWIRFDRYSPYFEGRAEYGLALSPHPMMKLIYPLADEDVFDLSYHFERREGSAALESRPGFQAVQTVAQAWQQAHLGERAPELRMRQESDCLVIHDTRGCAVRETTILRGRAMEVYLACRQAVALEDEALKQLREDRLLVTLDGRHLALAVSDEAPDFPYIPPFPGGDVALSRLPSEELVPLGGAFERMFWSAPGRGS